MQGIEPPPVFSFQSLKAISRSRAEIIISASMWPNRWGLTPPASEVVKGILFVGEARNNSLELMEKPGINNADAWFQKLICILLILL